MICQSGSETPRRGFRPTFSWLAERLRCQSGCRCPALKVLDADMDQYIHDNTDDEISHFTFTNAYLASKGAQPVNLDIFLLSRAVRRSAPSTSEKYLLP